MRDKFKINENHYLIDQNKFIDIANKVKKKAL